MRRTGFLADLSNALLARPVYRAAKPNTTETPAAPRSVTVDEFGVNRTDILMRVALDQQPVTLTSNGRDVAVLVSIPMWNDLHREDG